MAMAPSLLLWTSSASAGPVGLFSHAATTAAVAALTAAAVVIVSVFSSTGTAIVAAGVDWPTTGAAGGGGAGALVAVVEGGTTETGRVGTAPIGKVTLAAAAAVGNTSRVKDRFAAGFAAGILVDATPNILLPPAT